MSLHRALHAAPWLAACALLTLVPSVASARATDGTVSTVINVTDVTDVAYSAAGTLLMADPADHVVRFRRPDGSVGIAAGTGNGASDCPDTTGNADLGAPAGITFANNVFLVIDQGTNCVRLVKPDGSFVRIAGSADGAPGNDGDHGPADQAHLDSPSAAAIAADGSVYIADTGNDAVRVVTPQGQMLTFATGFSQPRDIALEPSGSLLVADTGHDRIVRIAPDGKQTTVANGFDVDSVSGVDGPQSILPLTHGGFLVSDTLRDRVRRVTPLGTSFTLNAVVVRGPEGLAARPGGGFTVADTGNDRVVDDTDIGAIPGAQLGTSFNLEPVRPGVTVFDQPLQEEDLIRLGSRVDATHGRLNVTVRRTDGTLEPGLIYAGAFVPTQRTNRDVTDLSMTGTLPCETTARSFLARKRRKPRRQLWVKAHGGRYNVHGRYVGALERGTHWHVVETCDSATVSVVTGSVTVRNLRTGRTRVVRAGHSLTIRV